MSRLASFRTLWIALLGLGFATACDDVQPIKTSGTLYLPIRSVDFQKVCINGTGSMDFQIQNDARATLQVTALELSSPAFKVLDAPALPLVIPGNGSVQIKLGFTPSKSGSFAGRLTVKSDSKDAASANQDVQLLGTGFDGENKKFEVSCICERGQESSCGLTGEVGAGRTTDRPCLFLSFDNVPNGTTLERTVRLENNGCEPLTIQSKFNNDPTYESLFTSAGTTEVTLRGGETRDVVVRFSPTGTDPVYPDVHLEVTSNDPTLRPGQTVAGQWTVNMIANSTTPELVVDPTILTFFDVNSGETVTKKFTVSNAGTGTLNVDSINIVPDNGSAAQYTLAVEGGATSFTLAPSGETGDHKEVSITFAPTSAGSQRATVKVASGPVVAEVRLVGGIEPTMEIEWQDPVTTNFKSGVIDFGATNTGDKGLTRTVRISNSGRADLVVSGIRINDPNGQPSNSYTIGAFSPKTVKPTESFLFDITFNDNLAVKDDLGKLLVASNDPNDALNPNGERTVDITSLNDPNLKPVVASTHTGGQICMELMLDATGTIGPEAGDTLTYKWELLTKPASSAITAASIEDSAAVKTRVKLNDAGCVGLDKIGDYDFKITATDQFGNTSSRTERVTIQ